MFVNPKDKTDRGVGMTTQQACIYGDICEGGCSQLLECYKDVNEWMLPEHFSRLCGSCPNAIHPVLNNSIESVFESAHDHNWICARSPKAFVYFITDGEFVKIGKAVDPYRRLSGIQTGNPKKCSIIAAIPCRSPGDANQLEHYLHVCYSSARAEGEWFDIIGDFDAEQFQAAYPPPRKENPDAAYLP